jgi:hypothetical protein
MAIERHCQQGLQQGLYPPLLVLVGKIPVTGDPFTAFWVLPISAQCCVFMLPIYLIMVNFDQQIYNKFYAR